MIPPADAETFLSFAYRELRALETEVIKELNPKGQRELDVTALSKVDVGQFYGSEKSANSPHASRRSRCG